MLVVQNKFLEYVDAADRCLFGMVLTNGNRFRYGLQRLVFRKTDVMALARWLYDHRNDKDVIDEV